MNTNESLLPLQKSPSLHELFSSVSIWDNPSTENVLNNLTHEYSHVVNDADVKNPVQLQHIHADTPLSDLYVNWTEKELPERERTKHVHRLHPYLGKYIPQLVETFLRKFFIPGQTVVDPFAGSGTTLVQANELGIHAIGYDISAFNIILMRAKTTRYNLEHVEQEIKDILYKVEQRTQNDYHQQKMFENSSASLDEVSAHNLYLISWFAPQALRELLCFRSLIPEYEYQDVLKVILSRSARSARLTTHFDLDFPKHPQIEPYQCYKHGRICHPTQTAFQFIQRYGLDTIKRLREYAALQTNASIQIYHENSATAQVSLVDGVITSPPYVGLIDYHEQHRYAYELLGLEDRRSEEIGAAACGISKKAQLSYQEGICKVFHNIGQSVKSGGYFIVVAGDKHNMYNDIVKSLGFECDSVINRHVNRRTGRRSTEFYESVFIWRKRK